MNKDLKSRLEALGQVPEQPFVFSEEYDLSTEEIHDLQMEALEEMCIALATENMGRIAASNIDAEYDNETSEEGFKEIAEKVSGTLKTIGAAISKSSKAFRLSIAAVFQDAQKFYKVNKKYLKAVNASETKVKLLVPSAVLDLKSSLEISKKNNEVAVKALVDFVERVHKADGKLTSKDVAEIDAIYKTIETYHDKIDTTKWLGLVKFGGGKQDVTMAEYCKLFAHTGWEETARFKDVNKEIGYVLSLLDLLWQVEGGSNSRFDWEIVAENGTTYSGGSAGKAKRDEYIRKMAKMVNVIYNDTFGIWTYYSKSLVGMKKIAAAAIKAELKEK